MSTSNLTPLKRVLTRLFPEQWLNQTAKATGAVSRRRKVRIVDWFWAVVLGYGVSKQRTIADLRRTYENSTGTTIEESSFYDRFTSGALRLLKKAVGRGLNEVRAASGRLKGALAAFEDLLLIDSSVIRLHDLLKGAYGGTRTNHSKAAAKLHVVMSVIKASATRLRVTAERVNDRTPWKRVGQWVRGRLLLFDLGYYSYGLFARIDNNEGFFLSRLKANTNPRIVGANRKWRGKSRSVVGQRLRDAIDGLRREVIDVNVEVSFERRAYRGRSHRDTRVFRVVGVRNDETGIYHLYMTNIAPAVLDAEQLAETYRLRWQVELLFKELKSHYRLEQMPSGKRVIVEALLHAAILTLIVSRALLDALRKTLPAGRHVPMLRWAAVFDALAPRLLDALTTTGQRLAGAPDDPWQLLASQAMDPNLARALAPDCAVDYA